MNKTLEQCKLPPKGYMCNLPSDHGGSCPTYVDYRDEPLAVNQYVRFKKETSAQLKALAEMNGVPKSTIIRRLIETHPEIEGRKYKSAQTNLTVNKE